MFVNLTRGISKVWVNKDLLFLKQIGKSTSCELKKFLIVDLRIKVKDSTIDSSGIFAQRVRSKLVSISGQTLCVSPTNTLKDL